MANATAGTAETPPHFSSLDAILSTALAMLSDGASRGDAPASLPVLASAGPDLVPQARTVVLRCFDAARQVLEVHTDARSGKMAELTANPHAALHVYDAENSIQIRIACQATVHRDGPLREEAWARKEDVSRLYYQVVQTPGDPLSDPDDAEFDAGKTDGGKDNFAVLELQISHFDWLYISREGHRHARFDWDGRQWQGAWLVP